MSLVKEEERSLSTDLAFSRSNWASAMIFSRDKELNLVLSCRARGLFSAGQRECMTFQLLPGLSSSSSESEDEELSEEEEPEELTVAFFDFLDFLDFFFFFLVCETDEDLDFLNSNKLQSNQEHCNEIRIRFKN